MCAYSWMIAVKKRRQGAALQSRFAARSHAPEAPWSAAACRRFGDCVGESCAKIYGALYKICLSRILNAKASKATTNVHWFLCGL